MCVCMCVCVCVCMCVIENDFSVSVTPIVFPVCRISPISVTSIAQLLYQCEYDAPNVKC